ncbi:MAG: hypothetical protein ABI221_00250 [Candidatus Saccharimonadales bacterium]
MDFTPRNSAAPNNNQPANHNVVASPAGKHRRGLKGNSLLRYSTLVMLFSGTVLVLAVAALFAFGGQRSEAHFVKKAQMQAVFLNGGQVYFGHISNVNDSFLTVSNVYYLRVNQPVQPDTSKTSTSGNDVSLVKLGCELHGPEDQMVINQSQVIFWENLKTDGQVAKAVAQFQKQNPNGQDCSTQAATTGASTGTSTTASQAASSTTTTNKQ